MTPQSETKAIKSARQIFNAATPDRDQLPDVRLIDKGIRQSKRLVNSNPRFGNFFNLQVVAAVGTPAAPISDKLIPAFGLGRFDHDRISAP